MFKFSLEIIFSAFLFLSTWNFTESQLNQFCSSSISELKFDKVVPTKIYSRSSQINITFKGDHGYVHDFKIYVSYDNMPRITCAQRSLTRVNSTYLQLGCTTNSSDLFPSFGIALKIKLDFFCTLDKNLVKPGEFHYALPQVEFNVIDPQVDSTEPVTIIAGHNCSYKIRYSKIDLEAGIPTPIEFGLVNGTKCIKKTDYSDFAVRKTDLFTCFLNETGWAPGNKLYATLFMKNYTWKTILFTVDVQPIVLQGQGSTFAGTIMSMYFTGVNLKSFREAYMTTEFSTEPNYCSIKSLTLMKCEGAIGLKPVEKSQQVKAYFWSHGNQMANGGKQVTFQQNPTPNRETIKSNIKDNVLTISIDHYNSSYIPWTSIIVYDSSLDKDIRCENITINADSNVTCSLNGIVSPYAEDHRVTISIGTWSANKVFVPDYRMVDLFFFKVAISFVLGLLLIYTGLYLLIRYKFKRPFNVRQVAFVVEHFAKVLSSKLSSSQHKSIILSKKSFTSLGRSKRSLESKSKSNLDKMRSKSLPKVKPSKQLKGILKHKSDLQYKSMLPDVTSVLTKSHNRSLVMESKSEDGETNVIKGKSKILTKHPLKVKPKTPAKVTKSVKKSISKAKSKPISKQFKRP